MRRERRRVAFNQCAKAAHGGVMRRKPCVYLSGMMSASSASAGHARALPRYGRRFLARSRRPAPRLQLLHLLPPYISRRPNDARHGTGQRATARRRATYAIVALLPANAMRASTPATSRRARRLKRRCHGGIEGELKENARRADDVRRGGTENVARSRRPVSAESRHRKLFPPGAMAASLAV